ncbi:MAG: phosphopyruvate hydratase [Planctomycetaceae bacterium]|nr:phosphopyruvate hydratase [Planctomycetales bacterium]MCB9920580.1 phosphopyruvate hydratase [Planctomycetaceae bacterium]
MSHISNVFAREVLDSRGKPTVEVEVTCKNGVRGRAIVPSGASTGQAEALELRDKDCVRYDGQGVQRAVANVNQKLGPAVMGMDAVDQQAIDAILLQQDATPQKSALGGNALLGVSLATAHAAAASRQVPLYRHINHLVRSSCSNTDREPLRPAMPLPMTNMISGGLHAGGNLDFQDVLITPVSAPDYATCLEWIVRVYRRLGDLLTRAGYEGRLVGDEGGYGPRLKGNREAVEFVARAIEAAELRPGEDVTIALDVAATHFLQHDGSYRLITEQGTTLTSAAMIDRLEAWVDMFPITSIEDGLAEEDWAGWQALTQRLGDRIQLVGDDLFTTNEHRIVKGIELGVGNSVLIKVNQIGTLTEALRAITVAREAGYSLVVSARSGETEDTTIADLAVGVAAEQIKIGSIVRSERLAKYNQLLRISEDL